MKRRKTRRRRKLVWLLAAVAIAVLGSVVVFYHGEIVARVVTWQAFRDAEEMAAALEPVREKSAGVRRSLFRRQSEFEVEFEKATEALAQSYEGYFQKGHFDRSYWLGRVPLEGATAEATAALVVFVAFYAANSERFGGAEEDVLETAVREFETWLDPLLLAPRSKEILVNLLVADYTILPQNDATEGLMKLLFFLCLALEDPLDVFSGDGFSLSPDQKEVKAVRGRLVNVVRERHWQAIVRDCHHPREKVRAGSLLFLYHHPRREVFLAEARKALRDGSEWVRLAVAGLLATLGDPSGAESLRAGLAHERWEVRFWSCHTLGSLKRGEDLGLLLCRRALEKDKVLQEFIELVIQKSSAGALEQLEPSWNWLRRQLGGVQTNTAETRKMESDSKPERP